MVEESPSGNCGKIREDTEIEVVVVPDTFVVAEEVVKLSIENGARGRT